jgi:hypothetical protein
LDVVKQVSNDTQPAEGLFDSVSSSFQRSHFQYDAVWKRWSAFCRVHELQVQQVDPRSLSLFAVFLCQGSMAVRPKTAINYTSLLSSILSAASSKDLLARILRGLNSANPSSQTRYDKIWDSDKLLAYIHLHLPDNTRLSESELRLKTSALLALFIFGRASVLFALRFHGLV